MLLGRKGEDWPVLTVLSSHSRVARSQSSRAIRVGEERELMRAIRAGGADRGQNVTLVGFKQRKVYE
jgi:hypothetical protein